MYHSRTIALQLPLLPHILPIGSLWLWYSYVQRTGYFYTLSCVPPHRDMPLTCSWSHAPNLEQHPWSYLGTSPVTSVKHPEDWGLRSVRVEEGKGNVYAVSSLVVFWVGSMWVVCSQGHPKQDTLGTWCRHTYGIKTMKLTTWSCCEFRLII